MLFYGTKGQGKQLALYSGLAIDLNTDAVQPLFSTNNMNQAQNLQNQKKFITSYLCLCMVEARLLSSL